MKFPNHIILDLNSSMSLESLRHWSSRNLISKKNLNVHNFFLNYFSRKLLNETPNLFFKSKNLTYGLFKNSKLKNKKFNFDLKIKNKKAAVSTPRIYLFKSIFVNSFKSNKAAVLKKNSLWDLFDIHFLRKEKIYTKLKYSRVPQYDIVSGGVAALFAGFLGFLICEKFGFELLDSGDFYIFFMYAVFFCFFSKLFFKLFSTEHQWPVWSFSWFYTFYKTIFNFLK